LLLYLHEEDGGKNWAEKRWRVPRTRPSTSSTNCLSRERSNMTNDLHGTKIRRYEVESLENGFRACSSTRSATQVMVVVVVTSGEDRFKSRSPGDFSIQHYSHCHFLSGKSNRTEECLREKCLAVASSFMSAFISFRFDGPNKEVHKPHDLARRHR
jgi:hypothetical protein